MAGVEDDSETAGPNRRSEVLTVGALALAVLIGVTQGVVAVLVLLLVLVVVALAVGIVVALGRATRGRLAASGEHPAPTLSPDTGPEAQRAEAGHVSPSATRSA